MRFRSLAPFSLTLLFACGGCANTPKQSALTSIDLLAGHSSVAPEAFFSPETLRAFDQEQRADLVIQFNDPTAIYLRVPPATRDNPAISEEQLPQALSRHRTKKNSVVVIMGKLMRTLPAAELTRKISALQAMLHRHGFQKVIIQQAGGSFRGIYRE